MTEPRPWTTPADIEAKVRRKWDSGELLRAYAGDDPFQPMSVSLRGPNRSEIGDDLGSAQAWVNTLESSAARGSRRRYTVERQQVGGRVVGRNLIPARAAISSYDEAWDLLGVRAEVAAYDDVLRLSSTTPEVHAWVVAHPLRALRVADEWRRLLVAYGWLRANRGRGLYLRQISAPDIDTKFVERHRGLLAELLEASGSAAQFASRLGFQDKPATVRLRFDAGFMGLPDHLSEATFRLEELALGRVTVRSAVIVENEITYLSVPVPVEGVVIFGEGFRVSRPGALPWLRDTTVHYWGDLDTHGFAILHQLRAWLPRTRSLLMDRETLLAHRDRWGPEPKPTSAALDKLTTFERSLYSDLVTGHYADNLRLEQERIDWSWVESHWPID